jgi:hypothetical protein
MVFNSPRHVETRVETRQAFETNFAQDIVRLIVVLDKTGDHSAAVKIQANALAVCNDAAIKDALTN